MMALIINGKWPHMDDSIDERRREVDKTTRRSIPSVSLMQVVGEWSPESRHARMLASNRLDTVGAMIEEVIRRASAQSAAAG
jgi:hypothetical protein